MELQDFGYFLPYVYDHCSVFHLLPLSLCSSSYFATTEDGFLTTVSHLLFWLLVGDAIWRAATKDGQGIDGNTDNRCEFYLAIYTLAWLC